MIEKIGAGEGNRTLVISLEGCCSTIELHPPYSTSFSLCLRQSPYAKASGDTLRCTSITGLPPEAAQQRRVVGEVGLEPTKL